MERTEFFDDKMINKSNLYKNKRLFDIYDIDVSNILISKKNLMVKTPIQILYWI